MDIRYGRQTLAQQVLDRYIDVGCFRRDTSDGTAADFRTRRHRRRLEGLACCPSALGIAQSFFGSVRPPGCRQARSTGGVCRTKGKLESAIILKPLSLNWKQ